MLLGIVPTKLVQFFFHFEGNFLFYINMLSSICCYKLPSYIQVMKGCACMTKEKLSGAVYSDCYTYINKCTSRLLALYLYQILHLLKNFV